MLEEAIRDKDLQEMLITIFNDKDENHTRQLETAIDELEGIGLLKHKPIVHSSEVGTEMVKDFEKMSLVPTLFFVDPWGYKGLSLKLINSVLKDWGCECIFFFNYNRINAGMSNPSVKRHMDALLGESRAEKLRPKLQAYTPRQRELAIVEEISSALVEMGGKYVIPFCFKQRDGKRTSHHLIFVSKHPLGYKIMKEVMAKECASDVDGVPTFEYNPAFKSEGILFEFARPLSELKEMLVKEYAGKTMKMVDIFDAHNYGRRFISSNYKAALGQLEADGLVTCDKPAISRRKHKGVTTFADNTLVTFPLR